MWGGGGGCLCGNACVAMCVCGVGAVCGGGELGDRTVYLVHKG